MILCCCGNGVTTFGKAWSRLHSFTPFIISLLCTSLSLLFFSIGAADSTITYSVKAPLAPGSLLLDGVFVAGRTVVVGERGHILISDDGGHSWHQASVPTQVTLTGVHFHDKNTGWAVGHDAIILRTKDGGKNWERVYYAPEKEAPLLDIFFKDLTNGIAVGAYGLFLVTADAGDTWTEQQIIDDDFHFNHIAKSLTGELFIASEAGRIYRSDNDGETWIELPSPYRGSFFGTLPLPNNTLLIFGLRGHMYRSHDSGQTWAPVKTSTTAMLTSGARLPDGTILIAGLSGTLLISRDNGSTFSLIQQIGRKGISSLVNAGDETLITIGENGVKKLSIPH